MGLLVRSVGWCGVVASALWFLLLVGVASWLLCWFSVGWCLDVCVAFPLDPVGGWIAVVFGFVWVLFG